LLYHLDGGEIYDTVKVKLTKEDNPFTAFAKSLKAGADLYAGIAKRLISKDIMETRK